MSDRYPILASLDPHHQRIGYLGALTLVAVRGLDTEGALGARLHDLLFERIYPEDRRFQDLRSKISDERWGELQDRRKGISEEEDPSSILSPQPEKAAGWFYISELWLHDDALPSCLGMQWPQYVQRTVQLGRWTKLLLPTYELSETGLILQLLLSEVLGVEPAESRNPLDPGIRPAVQLLYIRIMLQSEILFPYLIEEIQVRTKEEKPLKTRGKDGLLYATVERVLQSIGNQTDPEELFELTELFRFRDALERKESTHENYLRPRLEILVDLGIIDRKRGPDKSRNDFAWSPNKRTEIVASQLAEATRECSKIPEYLDAKFFWLMSELFERDIRIADNIDEKIFWFIRADEKIGREFGFTPGRTAATLACLLAWEAGILLEIDEVFDAVIQASDLPIGRFFHHSGGSRFDREFLIRIDKQAIDEIVRNQRQPGERSRE